MPITIEFPDGQSVVEIALVAPFKADEVIDASSTLTSDKRFAADSSLLVDCRSTDYVADTRTIRLLLQVILDKDLSEGHSIALVVSTDLQYGMGRVFASLAQVKGIKTQIFRSVEEAREWLADPAAEG
jgi:hypothetical protein